MGKILNNPFPGPVLVEEDGQRPFLEHLEELRRRLLRCFLWIGLGVAFCWGQAGRILSFLLKPIGPVVYLSPVEPFVVRMKTAFFGGLLAVFPLIAWEVWGFLRPAVRPGARWTLVPWIAASALLFFAGSWFGWAVLLPTALFFLRGFASDLLIPMITVGHYVSFATWIVLGCGLIFQLPLGILAATRAGWVQPAALARQWRMATVAILIAAAVLTPTPDIFTQLLLAAPLAALYLLSVGLSFLVRRERVMKSVCALVVLGTTAFVAGLARAETIELVTYYPAGGGGGAGGGDSQVRSLRVGNAYAAQTPPQDGRALILDTLGIGIPAGGGDPVGALEVRGAPDVADRVVFIPGVDTAAQPAVPSMFVGIGVQFPALPLHVERDINGLNPLVGVSNPSLGNNAVSILQVGQNLTFNTQNGMLAYAGPGVPADFQGYLNPNQFSVVASNGAVNGLALAALNGRAPIRFFTNAAVAGNERMRIAADGTVQVGASSLFVRGDQGGSLEIGGDNTVPNSVANGMPYIDFHFGRAGNPFEDFNARLINAADGRLDVQTSTNGAAAKTRLSIGNNLGVGITAPQPISPQNKEPTGNLDANDVFIRSRGQWVTQMLAGRALAVANVGNFNSFTSFNATERVIQGFTVTANGGPLLIAVAYIVCNDNNPQKGFGSRIRRDGAGTNGTIVIQHGGGVQPFICEGNTLVCVDTPPTGPHTYYFNLYNGTNNANLRGQATQMSVTQLSS